MWVGVFIFLLCVKLDISIVASLGKAVLSDTCFQTVSQAFLPGFPEAFGIGSEFHVKSEIVFM